LEIAEDDFLVGGGSGAEAPEIHGEGKRDLGYARSVVGRSEGQSLQDIGGGAEGLQAAHDGADDFGGGPFEAGGSERGAVGIVGEIVFHGAEGFVAGGWVESEVGVAAVASVVPLREFDIDFIFGVDADSRFGAVIEKAEDGGGIEFVNGTFDLPLISAKAEIFGGEDLGGGVGAIAINDAEMQVAVGINGNVSGIGFNDAGDGAVGGSPGAAHPLHSVRGWVSRGVGKIDGHRGEDEEINDNAGFS
jgi:hypothetical protein